MGGRQAVEITDSGSDQPPEPALLGLPSELVTGNDPQLSKTVSCLTALAFFAEAVACGKGIDAIGRRPEQRIDPMGWLCQPED